MFIEYLLEDWYCFCFGSIGVVVVIKISVLFFGSLYFGGREIVIKYLYLYILGINSSWVIWV